MRKTWLSFAPPQIGEEEIAEVVDTLRSDWITTGPKTRRFEQEFAAAVGAPRCLALNSCTAALHLALVASGIGPGDAVLTTPMTFCSTVHVIEQTGARPILVDVEEDTLNIDPAKLVEAVANFRRLPGKSGKLRAILPVHLYGHPCEMDSLLEIARRYSEVFSALEALQAPPSRAHVNHAWHLYVLRLCLDRLSISRDPFIEQLAARNIASSVHFIPIHLHRYYREKYGYRPEDFPVSYGEYRRMLSLPLHPGMSAQDVEDVIEAVSEIVLQNSVRRNISAAPYECGGARKEISNPAPMADSLARRLFDRSCALAGLVLLLPLFAVIALAIKLDDGGPVFYSHFRVGKNLRKFPLLKFRSMAADSAGGTPLTGPRDARVTRIGRILRKTKLDELPQLVNVLRGEMQLVGVRPQHEKYVEFYRDAYEQLLQVPPGITDLASLSFRDEEKLFQEGSIEDQYIQRILPKKLDLSLQYARARTFLSDVDILLRTVLGIKPPLFARDVRRAAAISPHLPKMISRNSS